MPREIGPKPPPPPKDTFRVRCLGPGPEHFFESVNKAKNRLCFACQRKLMAMAMGSVGHGKITDA